MLALGRLIARDEGAVMPREDDVPTPMPMLVVVVVVELAPPPLPLLMLVIPAAPDATRSQNGEH